jgi:hypothetical protein
VGGDEEEESVDAVADVTEDKSLSVRTSVSMCPPRISRWKQDGQDALQQLYIAVEQVLFPEEDAILASLRGWSLEESGDAVGRPVVDDADDAHSWV